MTHSFYAPAPDLDHADDTFEAYLAFLEDRNGDLSTFDRRHQRMGDVFDVASPAQGTEVDPTWFHRNYLQLSEPDVSPEALALLAFVKINAGEAYGVEVMGDARKGMWTDSMAHRLEQILLQEETFHTRLLVGATRHFEGIEVDDAWQPTWALRVLMAGLSKAPEAAFHPLLLGSEISGIYAFNWLLTRLNTLFPHDPQVRESMERRLLEVLVDEVGHVTFNRLMVGATGRSVARTAAWAVTQAHRVMSPELQLLGFDAATLSAVGRFDYPMLPLQVREQAFFA